MDNQKNKGEERGGYKTIIKIWIGFILFLIVIMTVVVTYDRYVFHKRVYEFAFVDVCSPKCEQGKHVVDTLNASIDFSILNIFNAQGTNVKIESVLDYLSKSDGLLGSNGLTYLVTLIVALLASLLTYRIEAMEELRADNKSYIDKIKKLMDEMRQSQDANKINEGRLIQFSEEQEKKAKELKTAVDCLNGEASDMKNEVVNLRKESVDLKGNYEKSMRKISSNYEHIAKFNRMLALNESIYNLSIVIGNVVSTFSLTKNDKEKDAIALEVGTLCSRLSLFCDQITDLFSDSKQRLSYLTRDEHYILSTYLDDALSGLNKSMTCIKDLNNVTLQSIINKKISIVENIKNIIDGVSRKEDNSIL